MYCLQSSLSAQISLTLLEPIDRATQQGSDRDSSPDSCHPTPLASRCWRRGGICHRGGRRTSRKRGRKNCGCRGGDRWWLRRPRRFHGLGKQRWSALGLNSAILSRAILSRAVLSRISLERSSLERVGLGRVNLRRVNLRRIGLGIRRS
ncbi:MAG: pentapeptide repeat-containing protein [Oscillatoriophycideae cyanobacterium NC_groundwater_1537_Pr4_S-0.65um_50_18]|nr:pentapeptide repeat-containing protein [Oscillatoriophycideae cyanobacterium NC_groundwater_1537_Pr4_S-0.65um_50_18]